MSSVCSDTVAFQRGYTTSSPGGRIPDQAGSQALDGNI